MAASVRIVGIVQRPLARQLFALLLLLALVAGGDRFAAIGMDMGGVQMSDMQQSDQDCKACGGTMSTAPCDVVCGALPAIDIAMVGLPSPGAHERWTARSESGAGFSIRPDTSPPRA